MKKFEKALNYYNKVNNIEIIWADKYILTLIYTTNFPQKKIDIFLTSSGTIVSEENIQNQKNIELQKTINYLKEKIWALNTTKQKKFYYSNSISCLIDFHTCKQEFENFYNQENLEITEDKLVDLKEKLDNYKNFWIDKLYLKNAYIIGSFFKYKLFPISINLSKELLEEKTNYKPILKIIAQSYFELWDLKYTKKYLSRYYTLDDNDYDVAYMLWVVNQKLHNYILSNIQLTKALKLWAKNESNIYRLQIYNYLILKDFDKILDTFEKLIYLNKKPNFNDLVLATYYNIINWNIKKAREFAELWITHYPNQEDFYWFKWWILEEKWKSIEAKEAFLKWHKINNKNALINYHLWKIMLTSDELIQSRIYFKRAEKLDKWWDITKLSLIWLEEIKKINELKNNEIK
jgi:hypothetical protein